MIVQSVPRRIAPSEHLFLFRPHQPTMNGAPLTYQHLDSLTSLPQMQSLHLDPPTLFTMIQRQQYLDCLTSFPVMKSRDLRIKSTGHASSIVHCRKSLNAALPESICCIL